MPRIAKLTSKQVLEIRRLAPSTTYEALAKRYKVTSNTIADISRGLSYRHVPWVAGTAPEPPAAAARRLSDHEVAEVRRRRVAGETASAIAASMQISPTTINKIMSGETHAVAADKDDPAFGSGSQIFRVSGKDYAAAMDRFVRFPAQQVTEEAATAQPSPYSDARAIKPGDVVSLRSGSPPLTVVRVDGTHVVVTAWTPSGPVEHRVATSTVRRAA